MLGIYFISSKVDELQAIFKISFKKMFLTVVIIKS